MQERQVAQQRERRPPPARWCASAAPTAVEIVPSMPATPRLASTVTSPRGHGQPVDVADRRGRAEHQQRPGRQGRDDVAGQPGGGQLGRGVEHGVDHRADARRRPPARHRASPSATGSPPAGRPATPSGRPRLPPRAASAQRGVAGDRSRPAPSGRRAAPRPAATGSGARRRAPGRAGARPASRPAPSSSAPPRSASSAPHAPLLGSATTGHRQASASAAAARPTAGGASPTTTSVRGGPRAAARTARGGRGGARSTGRRPAGPPRARRGRRRRRRRAAAARGRRGSGAPAPDRRTARRGDQQRPGDQRAPVPVLRLLAPGLGHADVGGPAHRAAVEPGLLDRLVGAGGAQLRRAGRR